jgi:hypothetical protein
MERKVVVLTPSKEVSNGDPLFPFDIDSPDLDPPLEVSKYEIEDEKVIEEITEQSKMQEETPQNIEEKVDSSSLDLGKESQVHPNSNALVSWENEEDKVEASGNSDPPDPGNEGMVGLASTPLNLNVGWKVIRKKKNTPSIFHPMVIRSRARNPT